MPRYIDLNNPKIIQTGRDKFGNGIYHVPPDLPTADVVDRERYDRLLENSTIIAAALSKYQSADMVEVVRCKKCKKWRENIGGGNYGYCYRDYGLPRTTDASDYCSWWEKKERSEE